MNFMLSVVKGIEPRDQIEAMLAAQMAAVHMASMTFARRLANVQNIPQQDSAQNAFNKLAAPNRNGAGTRANRQQCGAIASVGCTARVGTPRGDRNAVKHGQFAAETLPLKREFRPWPVWPARRSPRLNRATRPTFVAELLVRLMARAAEHLAQAPKIVAQ